jgi:hypothetical protein
VPDAFNYNTSVRVHGTQAEIEHKHVVNDAVEIKQKYMMSDTVE